MGIDLNLLRKIAKVYEAAESVDNMPVKHTRESHKKCAPGEFGMNKEGKSLQALAVKQAAPGLADPDLYKALAVYTAIGAGGGGALGALLSPKGKMLRHALRGAIRGGGGGLGAGISGLTAGAAARSFGQSDDVATPVGALGGAALGYGLANRAVEEYDSDEDDKTAGAFNFGASVKQALDPALGMAGLGGAGGLIAGGLSGLIAPGEYEDEDGNVKRRGRLSTALQRALGMGAVGAGLGGAYGMYDREGSGKAVDFARQLYQSLMGGGKQPAESIRADASLQADPGVKPVKPVNYDATLRPASVKPETSALGNFGTSSLFGGEQQKAPAGTYSSTPEKYVQQRSADAKHKNTLTFPYGKETDPLTGEAAVPFNMQR